MNKNLKLSYILLFVFSGILLAFKTLSAFFCGVGVNFVAMLGIVFAVLLICLKDKEIMKRIRDLFIVACVFCVMELIIYFACEFGRGETFTGFSVYQNVISFLGILFLGYMCFRFATEVAGKKIKFIEILLGNEKRQPKAKKAKELTNGSLEDKPNNKQPQEVKLAETEENKTEKSEEITEEAVVIVETEE
ncbi:MAG: hypothetical protein J6Q13_03100 [Clostridia bacterium]|nr:hypothetical protein [Clostridia bacterium]